MCIIAECSMGCWLSKSVFILYNKLFALKEIKGLHSSCNLDIDECALDQDLCSEFASCNDSEGSYNCSCNDGFYGDGFDCTGMYDR